MTYIQFSPSLQVEVEPGAGLLERSEKVLGLLPCEECGHSLDLHFDRYGCEYEMGDRPGDESGPAEARGTCCCKAENLSSDGNDQFLLLRDLRQVRLLREIAAQAELDQITEREDSRYSDPAKTSGRL